MWRTDGYGDDPGIESRPGWASNKCLGVARACDSISVGPEHRARVRGPRSTWNRRLASRMNVGVKRPVNQVLETVIRADYLLSTDSYKMQVSRPIGDGSAQGGFTSYPFRRAYQRACSLACLV